MLIRVQFVETALFSAQLQASLSDDEYASLQRFLAENPEAGPVIQGAGGIRKLRWADRRSGRGKRGGHRVIYFYRASHEQILMLALYSKSEQADLTPAQKRKLAEIVNTWK